MDISKKFYYYTITDTWNDYDVNGTLDVKDDISLSLHFTSGDTTHNFNYNYTDDEHVSVYLSCTKAIRKDLLTYCNTAVDDAMQLYEDELKNTTTE